MLRAVAFTRHLKDVRLHEEALADASRLGYAEADPTLDVGGFDARSKLRILMRMGFGVDVDEEEISCRGITELSKLDFDYAKRMGGTVKLIGVALALSLFAFRLIPRGTT